MDRRTFLVATAGTGTLLGGCLAPAGGGTERPTTPAVVDGYEFALAWSADREPLAAGHAHAATAAVESGEGPPRLRVVGQLASGSRSCTETALGGLAHDRGTLTVGVADEFVPGPDEECTAEQAVVPYELLVTFAADVPTTVEVVHRSDGREEFQETIRVG